MNISGKLEKIEKYIESTLPNPKQAAIAQIFRDMGTFKITPSEGLNEIRRIREGVRK